MVTLPDKRLPVFTQVERIYDQSFVQGEIKYLKISGSNLFELTKGNTIIINPFSNYSKVLAPEEIEKIKNGSVLFDTSRTREISRDSEVVIGQPKEYNMDLIQSLKIQYNDNPSIKSAYIALIQYIETGLPPNLLIAIDTEDDFDEIANDTGFTAEQYLKK